MKVLQKLALERSEPWALFPKNNRIRISFTKAIDLDIFGTTKTGKHPPLIQVKKVAIAGTN